MRFAGDSAHNDLGRIQRIRKGLAGGLGPASRSQPGGWAGDLPLPAAGVTGQIDRRKFLLAGTAGTAGAVLFSGPSLTALLTGPSVKARTAAATAAAAGQWTAPFDLTLVSIHAVVLRTGNVLLFSRPTSTTVGSDAVLWNPASGSITNIALTYQRDIFCSGMTALPAGRVFIAGGHIYQGTTLGVHQGVANTTIFGPGPNSWTEGPLMDVPRWYATTVQIGDGSVRIMGGTVNPTTDAVTIDAYDPSANPSLTVLPSTANKSMSTYPRVKLTTTGLLAWTNAATTYFLNPATSVWTTGPKLNSGTRNVNDTSVLLPGLTKIMEIGGTTSRGTTATAEILDLSVSPLAWKPTASMSFGRVWANAVLLADGTVLVIGGGASGSYTGPVLTPELYDPVAGTWTQMAAQTAPRMYHSTAVLLPDGRVLSAGQSDGPLEQTGEVFSPPYLFAGARPTITSAPASVGYNQQFTITTPNFASIGRVALVKAGSVTHSNNFDQRYVDLTYTSNGSSGLTATSPPDGNHAPSGYYMLFILSSSGVPSVARWILVG